MKKVLWTFCFLVIITAFWVVQCQAQTSAGKPIKYYKEFTGIGPKVYILPPPKTEKEKMEEQYLVKKKEQGELVELMNQFKLANKLKRLDNGILPAVAGRGNSESKEEQIVIAINYYKQQFQLDSARAWKNYLGTFNLSIGKTDEAKKILLEVLGEYEVTGDIERQQALMHNLAILEEHGGNYIEALAYYDRLLAIAKKKKDMKAEGLLSLNIAVLESKLGNFAAAHNLVLKKSFPLLKRTKHFSDVVKALNTLAQIKEREDKLTEAKWIFLQAIDVSTIYKDEKGLAESLFNLARLKTAVGDAVLAIDDYKLAKHWATKHEMDALLIEIEDGLGDAYLLMGDYSEAFLTLNSYHTLKSEFISNQTRM